MVRHLRIRPTAETFDYVLNPAQFGSQYKAASIEFQGLTRDVADSLAYSPEWTRNKDDDLLALLNEPQRLIDRSKGQDVILYRDENLIVYGVLWEWLLVRKLKRLSLEDRDVSIDDWKDCVIICKLLYDKNGGPLDLSIFEQFDDTEREPPVSERTLANLTRLVMDREGVDPFQNQRLRALITAAEASSCISMGVFAQTPNRYWAYSRQQQRWAFIFDDQGPRPQSEWPQPGGKARVFLMDDGMWRWYDFDEMTWE